MLAILSGGTGTPKLLQGLMEVYEEENINVVVNTAEDEWLEFGFLSPDVDTVIYTLAGMVNEKTWYGIKNDTFVTHKMLERMGYMEVLKIGDMDRAIKIQKGELLSKGKKLSEAIEIQKKGFGIKAKVFPMSDDPVVTKIKTPEKEMNFHEFWVENKGKPEVLGVYFRGIEQAKPCRGALHCLKKADGIIIGPSNPITSILPIISLKAVKKEITKKKDRCIAISPIIKNKPVSGPAVKLMESSKLKVNSYSVASFYREMISSFVIDSAEQESKIKEIESLGIKCYRTNTLMRTIEDKKLLSIFVLKTLGLIE